jgi:hypothetical protein
MIDMGKRFPGDHAVVRTVIANTIMESAEPANSLSLVIDIRSGTPGRAKTDVDHGKRAPGKLSPVGGRPRTGR